MFQLMAAIHISTHTLLFDLYLIWNILHFYQWHRLKCCWTSAIRRVQLDQHYKSWVDNNLCCSARLWNNSFNCYSPSASAGSTSPLISSFLIPWCSLKFHSKPSEKVHLSVIFMSPHKGFDFSKYWRPSYRFSYRMHCCKPLVKYHVHLW
jgi:hypothetical protein